MQVKTKEAINSSKLSELVAQGMVEKKASDVVVMDLREVKNAVADYFIICSGNSDTQIDAIADSIEDEVFKHSTQNPWKREGKESREWIIIDYVDVVAHVFNKEKRKFYGLEELWGDAKVTQIDKEN
ncbi:ribosome silencing factor [Marinoscillum sp. 108]|uniref:Ribosomal silencing factor RsfS n=1 Tax=Marinoscillum luteum TaxID=861051 RepID=A0ABW7N8X6_9BACT|nr:ribosome silencing factor [Marinoscillum sp. 108]VXD17155.1 Ribosomal silencing factor RsfS [Marinoscillum sp. 108]|eukprot:gnl/MRDRNA2_/MRDRNA2_144877_c0_seq1.p1 gnl/MRDRNA2_/MRDRNA2_144877_c0~~gnl/MRDRNA2_/MRDRNA2_144877_c0_seq1.p1  ORF type:complete len:127 (+),score=23.56 gnl/MRDRNA2_/MRDRNA2_144877_c0_seq1:40-420(+)